MGILLVTGSRTLPKAMEFLVRLHLKRTEPTVLIHGGAGGVDAFAARWAYDSGVEAHSYPAKWREHVKPWCRCSDTTCFGNAAGSNYCKGAAQRRNQQMLDEGHPTHVLAFPSLLSIGAWDMVRRAARAGLPIHVVPLVDHPTFNVLEHRPQRSTKGR